MELGLSVKNQSIEAAGLTKDYQEAICEYIWNGFEANATRVEISTVPNTVGGVEDLVITDNGDGIDYELLPDTFGSFMASQKTGLSLQLKSKTNKGKGRFAFFAFATDAVWDTVYTGKEGTFEYKIALDNVNKSTCDVSDYLAIDAPTGTTVTFGGIDNLLVDDITIDNLETTLLKTFAWYLYLNKHKKKQVIVNGEVLDYKKYINEKMSAFKQVEIKGHTFDLDLVVWTDKIRENYSTYYLDSCQKPCGKDTTKYNRNTLSFSHSVFVQSAYFDGKSSVSMKTETDEESEDQVNFVVQDEERKILKTLKCEIQELISAQIRFYAIAQADKAIKQMHKRDVFPTFGTDPYSLLRKKDLETVTKEIYCLEPKLFYKLNAQQEKSFLGFLNLLLNSEERENILEILANIVDLTAEQRFQFADVLKRTKLENIISTIKFVEDRYAVIEGLKMIVYDMRQYANERDHVQKVIEQHYWLFGEQYHLVSADERMQKAIDQYRHILYGNDVKNEALEPDKEAQRRMDIFLCGVRRTEDGFEKPIQENLVIELKAPKVVLGKTVLRQIEDYMDFVRRQPMFNSQTRRWKFIAVCASIDDDIKSRYEANKSKGKKGLVTDIENYEIYALTWDDIFNSFDLSHGFLLDQLKIDRDAIAENLAKSVGDDSSRESADAVTEALCAIS
ncbi:ATP-binding protein [Bengtsoniella intestinalis]|uniref:ATP-binding protein n=1 Tax=Bengtsoniella intestinalis TaxID=3073143 RepID=UPI00391FB0F3